MKFEANRNSYVENILKSLSEAWKSIENQPVHLNQPIPSNFIRAPKIITSNETVDRTCCYIRIEAPRIKFFASSKYFNNFDNCTLILTDYYHLSLVEDIRCTQCNFLLVLTVETRKIIYHFECIENYRYSRYPLLMILL